jgi:hypothetical protein
MNNAMNNRATKVAVFALILLSTGLLFVLMMPSAKSLPLLIILFGAGALLIPFVLMSKPAHTGGQDPNGCDGKSISCCNGPRPVGTRRTKANPTTPTHPSGTTNAADPLIVGMISGPIGGQIDGPVDSPTDAPFGLDLPDIDM